MANRITGDSAPTSSDLDQFNHINDVIKSCENYRDITKLLAQELKKAVPELNREGVSLGYTAGSVVLSLHNLDKRPTRYSFELRGKEKDFPMHVPKITMDTIIAENPEHFSDKQPGVSLNYAMALMKVCAKQPSDGTPENTYLNYESIGMLMRKREQPLPPLDVAIECAEAVKFISDVIECDNPVQLKEAMVDAFNAGTAQGRWWVDQYFMQDVSRLVLGGEDKFLPRGLPYSGQPFKGAKYNDSLYQAISTIENKSSDVFSAMTDYRLYDFSRAADELTRALKKKYPALASVKSTLPQDEYAKKVEAFNGIDSAQAGAFNLHENLRANTVKYNAEEQGRNAVRSVVSAMYSHAIAVAQEKNTRSAVRAMRDTVLLQSREGFSVSHTHAILSGMQASSYLDFCIEQAKDEFTFSTPEAIDALRIMSEERSKNVPVTPISEEERRAEANSMVNSIIDEIKAEENDPEAKAKKMQAKKDIVSAGEAFAQQSDSYEAEPSFVLALVDVANKAALIPEGNAEFAAKFVHAEMDKHGYMMPKNTNGTSITDMVKSMGGGEDYQPICEHHSPLCDISAIPNVAMTMPKPDEDITPQLTATRGR